MSRKRNISYGYFFVLPGAFLLFSFLILSALLSAGFSFTNFNLLRPEDARFVAFDNYIRLFSDPSFLKALKNTLYFTVIVVPYQVTLAFALALLVKANIRGIGIFRSAYFSPLMTSISVVAILPGPFKCHPDQVWTSRLRFFKKRRYSYEFHYLYVRLARCRIPDDDPSCRASVNSRGPV